MLLVVVTRERCVEMCTMGPHLKQAKWQEYHPQRSGHSAPPLPQVLVSQTVSLLPTFQKPMLRKGIRPSLLVGGDGRERQAFESCKRMAAWENLFKTRTGQAYGSVWPPRRKGYWVGLHRLQAEPRDPEVADLMGFPRPTRQRRCRCSKCWRITVAWIMGMLVKHMKNHNLHSASPHTHTIGSCQALGGESYRWETVSLSLPGKAVSDWEEKTQHTPGWGLRILCIT